jgi:integrase
MKDDYTNKARRSWDRAERSIKRLREVFGADLAVHITDRRIDRYAADRLRDGASRATVVNELAALKRMFSLAVKKKLLSQRPAFPEFGDLKNAREEFFEDWEYAALHGELPDHLKNVLTFIFFTGWRFNSEVRTLRWEQVDSERGFVSLHVYDTKNDEGRHFPFASLPELKAAIDGQRAYTDEVEQQTGRIIPWVFHKEGKQIDNHNNGFYKTWREATARLPAFGCPAIGVGRGAA